MKEVKSCYIHIPFCKNICSYCDFCKFYYQEELVDSYIDVLLEEMKMRYQNEVLETIYIGGGTPSSLSVLQLKKLLARIREILTLASDYEFTIECNLMDIEEEKLILFQEFGINRLSIGVESSDTNILKVLERNYTKEDIISRLTLAKRYFSNINVDLMYAVLGEDIPILKKDLEFLLSFQLPHISIYSLMIEDHTKLKIKKMVPISEELDEEMYFMIESILEENGYSHYEISNYAISGYQSRHNQTYWDNNRYYGFGLGASGYIRNVRYSNVRNIKRYLKKDFIQKEEIVSSLIDASNYAILGLRTLKGVAKEVFYEKFNQDFKDYFEISDLIKENIIIEMADRYYLNPKYWYISNEILVKFI